VRTQTLLGAAAGIAVVTVAARVVGFGRTAVLAQSVGASHVGDTYTAVNALPNVLFEVAAGGALAAVVVPLVAGALAAGSREDVDRTVSALLSWTVVVLVPVALLGALAAPLLVRLVLADGTGAGAEEVGTRLLRVFAPQVVLYGVAVVLTGVLQAHRRFLAPALAPLLSSLVVITAYLLYAGSGPVAEPADLTGSQELLLGVGTTLGVAALALSVVVPLRGTGLRLRPTLSFPAGNAARARALAGSGVVSLAAQQVALLVALRLSAGGQAGSVLVWTVAVAVFLLPWAVLAVPVATSAFPRLTEAAAKGDGRAEAEVLRTSLRSVLALSALGTLALLAVAGPVADVLLRTGAPGLDDGALLRDAVRALALGLVGHGAAALLSRALLARGRAMDSAVGTAVGWLSAAALSVVLVHATDLEPVVAIGLATSTGLTAGAVVLGLLLARARRG
jgi:putative peptidoglycan lipid II flippase